MYIYNICVCQIYNAPSVVLDDTFARREIQLSMGWNVKKNSLTVF